MRQITHNLKATDPPPPAITDHVFVGDDNRFRCQRCDQPRAIHAQTGFRPGSGQSHIVMGSAVRYSRPIQYVDKQTPKETVP